jgi:hypothetical protein
MKGTFRMPAGVGNYGDDDFCNGTRGRRPSTPPRSHSSGTKYTRSSPASTSTS